MIGQDRHICFRDGPVTIVWSIWSMVVYDYITWYCPIRITSLVNIYILALTSVGFSLLYPSMIP